MSASAPFPSPREQAISQRRSVNFAQLIKSPRASATDRACVSISWASSGLCIASATRDLTGAESTRSSVVPLNAAAIASISADAAVAAEISPSSMATLARVSSKAPLARETACTPTSEEVASVRARCRWPCLNSRNARFARAAEARELRPCASATEWAERAHSVASPLRAKWYSAPERANRANASIEALGSGLRRLRADVSSATATFGRLRCAWACPTLACSAALS